MNITQSLILGVVEGLTEFLPVSSTGHMIITSSFMNIQEDEFVKAFEVIIQFGAILSVLFLYWRKFLPDWPFYKKLLLAFLPTAIIGFIVKHQVDRLLGYTQLVAWTLLIGGIILVWSDHFFRHLQHEGRRIGSLKALDCVKLGLYQSIAMIPGVSRSAATILGGMTLGMNKKEATEFSFFLAVPTMFAATAYKGFKLYRSHTDLSQINVLAVGFVVAFIVSIFAIKLFIGIVSRYGFKGFGYYRIAFGLFLLAMIYSGKL